MNIQEVLKKHKEWLNDDAKGRRANLQSANLDFSCLPLWCGGTKMIVHDKLAKQFLYHALCSMSQEQLKQCLKDPVAYANDFHRIDEVYEIKVEYLSSKE